MFIKSLRICNTANNTVMREVSFHKGTNFIVDTDTSGRHNKVGKTTFLKLIDVLMGAQNKSYVYTDQETNNETVQLREIITEKRIAAEMTLVRDLDGPCGASTELKVDLFPRGGCYFDGERVSQRVYREKLNALLFGIENNVPTFRQLINSFVRVSVGGDDNAFLRTLTRTSNAVYRSVYNFLFDISNPELDDMLHRLNTQLNHVQESLTQYKRVNGVEDVEQQRQILVALEREYERIKTQADDIFDSTEYRTNRDAISSAREEYAKLTDSIEELDYRIDRSRAALASAREELSRQADLNLSRKFFDEICSILPDLNKTFEEMVLFNNKLCDNKIAYFEEIDARLVAKRADVIARREHLVSENGRFLSLVTSTKIDDYEHLMSSLMQLRQNIGRRKEIVDTLDRYDIDLADIQSNIERYSTGGSAREGTGREYQDMMDAFNVFFTPLAERINGESPILVYSPDTDKFPVSITELSGSSTGTRKSLIAAFDLAYQQFAIANQIHAPRFIVHDVVENVEGDDLHTVVEAANSVDAQYIVAVLKEKLDSSHISSEEQDKLQILRLADDDKLFEGKSVTEAESHAFVGMVERAAREVSVA